MVSLVVRAKLGARSQVQFPLRDLSCIQVRDHRSVKLCKPLKKIYFDTNTILCPWYALTRQLYARRIKNSLKLYDGRHAIFLFINAFSPLLTADALTSINHYISSHLINLSDRYQSDYTICLAIMNPILPVKNLTSSIIVDMQLGEKHIVALLDDLNQLILQQELSSRQKLMLVTHF